MASELEYELQDIVDLGTKWVVDFNAGKTELVLFDRSDNTGAIDVKMDGSVYKEKSSFKILGLNFSCKLDWSSYIKSITETASKKAGALSLVLLSFFLMRLLCISINLPQYHGFAPTWNCYESYKNRYAGLLVLHLLPHLSPWFIVEI